MKKIYIIIIIYVIGGKYKMEKSKTNLKTILLIIAIIIIVILGAIAFIFYKDKTVWFSQKAMSMLFDCSTDNIGLHLKNIFAFGELYIIKQLPSFSRQFL